MPTETMGCLPMRPGYVSYFAFDISAGSIDVLTAVSLTSTEPEMNGKDFDCQPIHLFDSDQWIVARWPGYDPVRLPWGGTRQINITITVKGTLKGAAAVVNVDRKVVIARDNLPAAPP